MLEEHCPGVLVARITSLDDLTAHQRTLMRGSLALEAEDAGPVALVIDVSPEVARAQLDEGRFWLELIEDGLVSSLAIVSPWAAIRLMGRAVGLAVHERGLRVDVDTFSSPDEAVEWASSSGEHVVPQLSLT